MQTRVRGQATEPLRARDVGGREGPQVVVPRPVENGDAGHTRGGPGVRTLHVAAAEKRSGSGVRKDRMSRMRPSSHALNGALSLLGATFVERCDIARCIRGFDDARACPAGAGGV